jgi:secondary thiamine-phosphate synthase enzyme
MIHSLFVSTHSKTEFVDVTGKIRDIVKSSGVRSGVCHVFVPHTSAGVTIIEHADPNVAEDVAAQLDLFAPKANKYRHVEGNAHAHIKSSIMGVTKTLFIEDGRLVLGEWQGISLCEFDGPRNRSLMIKIVEDK